MFPSTVAVSVVVVVVAVVAVAVSVVAVSVLALWLFFLSLLTKVLHFNCVPLSLLVTSSCNLAISHI